MQIGSKMICFLRSTTVHIFFKIRSRGTGRTGRRETLIIYSALTFYQQMVALQPLYLCFQPTVSVVVTLFLKYNP